MGIFYGNFFFLFISDVYLKSIVGIADSLYNLRLIRTFCDKYIPNKTCHFTYEDMLYSKEPLKENFLVMVSELFYWFEIKPLSAVTGGGRVSSVLAEDTGMYLSLLLCCCYTSRVSRAA